VQTVLPFDCKRAAVKGRRQAFGQHRQASTDVDKDRLAYKLDETSICTHDAPTLMLEELQGS
jgi:hypothetical protein